MKNGATHIVPCELIQGLRDAAPCDMGAVELGLRGASLHWEKLDQDFTIGGLVRGIFGTKKWMEQLRRSKIKAKSAARANGGVDEKKTAPSPKAATAATTTTSRRERKAA